ncbi:MAG: response regulator [Bdellovibrionaceae bacterium]|nr:response regulator [Pseudobdellovibrionaceae bacterium]
MKSCAQCGFEISEFKRISDSKRHLAAQARALQIDAIEAGQKRDEFLAILSHELRTPLTTILGWAQQLRTNPLKLETIMDGLDIIVRNALNQKQLIDDLLTVSRLHAGKILFNFEVIRPQGVIERAVDSIRYLALLKSIEIKLQLGSPEWRVSVDAERLQEVVWRLLINAIKFTPKGGLIFVNVGLSDTSRRRMLSIQIADTGIGVRADQMDQIFKLFTQSDSTLTRPYGGLGLGLFISKSLVKMQGGAISVESLGEGKGAAFKVDLPLIRAKSIDVRPNPGQRANEDRLCRLDGVRILIIDDSEDIRILFRFFFESIGARVRLAESAGEGLIAYGEFRPHILLSDIQMPGEDGYDLIRKIRALEEHAQVRKIPSIAVTAYAAADDVRKAIDAGFSAHVSKPVEKAYLSKIIFDLVNNAAGL